MEATTLRPMSPIAYGQYANLSPEERKAVSLEKLGAYIKANTAGAARAVERIMTEVPQDSLVRASAVDVDSMNGFVLRTRQEGKAVGSLHPHALDQLATRLGMPTRYLHELESSEWGRHLVAQNLNTLAAEGVGDEAKFLVRTVGQQIRAVLSPSYRTDDSRPALDALLGVAKDVGAIVAAGSALDTKTSIKIINPRPVELFEGEWGIVGLDYRNSDYGDGARDIMGWILRLACFNGATTTSQFRRVHLGRRIQDEVEYSDKTRKLNADFTASATRDMAKALLGEDAVTKMVERVRAAHAKELDPTLAMRALKTRVNKTEEKAIVEKYNSPDIELLPPGNTTWRFSNAVSWLATQTEDSHRRLDLEQLAGEFIA